jgi:hypothetical protein
MATLMRFSQHRDEVGAEHVQHQDFSVFSLWNLCAMSTCDKDGQRLRRGCAGEVQAKLSISPGENISGQPQEASCVAHPGIFESLQTPQDSGSVQNVVRLVALLTGALIQARCYLHNIVQASTATQAIANHTPSDCVPLVVAISEVLFPEKSFRTVGSQPQSSPQQSLPMEPFFLHSSQAALRNFDSNISEYPKELKSLSVCQRHSLSRFECDSKTAGGCTSMVRARVCRLENCVSWEGPEALVLLPKNSTSTQLNRDRPSHHGNYSSQWSRIFLRPRAPT